MCGIAGIIGNRVPDMEARAARMSLAMAHRGPDACGLNLWPGVNAPQIAFAHRRLAIIDLSEAGRQPMTTADGRYSIIFNGEIYNFQVLRKTLEASGVIFQTNTDTEVLLHLYARQGRACLSLLEGMFVFALRDHHSGEVFIARDRLGIKPLYYWADDGIFVFASELRSLLASDLMPRLLDAVSLNAYLSFGAVQEPRTIIRHVRTLPPAHYMIVDAAGRIKEQARYWELPVAALRISRTEAIAETRARLEASVRSHLVADVPLGAFLSGGIDSSAIVALMSRYAPGRVQTLTVCFEEHEFNERQLARQVAEKWGTAHTEVALSEAEMLASLPAAIADIDQPTIDGINTWIVARATKQAGLTVALSGLGGDELFGGYPSFRRAARLQRYGLSINWLNEPARQQMARVTGKLLGNSLPGQKVASAIAAGGDLLQAYASMRGLFSKASRAHLLHAEASSQIPGNGHYHIPAETLELIRHNGNGGDVFNRISRYEMNLYMANMLLRDTDAMSMASALEVRVPLLDHHLIEWVYALPGKMKTGQSPKQLLIDAMGADLLPEVIGHKKMGFALPFERWMHTSVKAFVTDALHDTQAVTCAGLNVAAVSDVIEQFDRGARSTSWSRVLGLAILVDWCRRHQVAIAA
jgi:asparagine synthase (glutamine-hydrolyzing)